MMVPLLKVTKGYVGTFSSVSIIMYLLIQTSGRDKTIVKMPIYALEAALTDDHSEY